MTLADCSRATVVDMDDLARVLAREVRDGDYESQHYLTNAARTLRRCIDRDAEALNRMAAELAKSAERGVTLEVSSARIRLEESASQLMREAEAFQAKVIDMVVGRWPL